MERICKRFFIEGKVQGVFFRDKACKKARELEITGWVRNLHDGRVELLACGAPEKISILEKWSWQGPATAHVSKVEAHNITFEPHSSFVILCSDRF